jgi:hypothetical protein
MLTGSMIDDLIRASIVNHRFNELAISACQKLSEIQCECPE